MKKFTKFLALTLVAAMCIVMLASCAGSTYGKIKVAFEAEGYTLQNPDDEPTETIKTDNGEITIVVHTFQKESESSGGMLDDIWGEIGELSSTVVIWEFKSNKEMKKAMESDEILKEFKDSDYVNGNCVLLMGSDEANEIFKNA